MFETVTRWISLLTGLVTIVTVYFSSSILKYLRVKHGILWSEELEIISVFVLPSLCIFFFILSLITDSAKGCMSSLLALIALLVALVNALWLFFASAFSGGWSM